MKMQAENHVKNVLVTLKAQYSEHGRQLAKQIFLYRQAGFTTRQMAGWLNYTTGTVLRKVKLGKEIDAGRISQEEWDELGEIALAHIIWCKQPMSKFNKNLLRTLSWSEFREYYGFGKAMVQRNQQMTVAQGKRWDKAKAKHGPDFVSAVLKALGF